LKRYCASSSKQILFDGRTKIEFGVFNFTDRMIPSFPGKTSMIRASGQKLSGDVV